MFWFVTAVSINCFAILLLLINQVYDALTTGNSYGQNASLNLIGIALAIIVIAAFAFKNSGKLQAAKILLWLAAAPLSVLFTCWFLYVIVVLITGKPDWR